MRIPIFSGLLLVWLAGIASAQADDEYFFEPPMDSAESAVRDSTTRQTNYQFIGLNEHVGNNGITFFASFISQQYRSNAEFPQSHTFGCGFSGDVLTGISFVHLMPVVQYWGYTEDIALGPFVSQSFKDVGFSFHAVFFTRRLTSRMFRVFGGAGPSLHLTVRSRSDAYGNSENIPGFKNGLGLIGGLELPLTSIVSFVLTGSYKQTYEWSSLYTRFLSISVGFAI